MGQKMINENCFTPEWITQKRIELHTDPYLLERAIHAFALLGHLVESSLEFVFKGGTCMLLHVPIIRRLSIDIDILCAATSETLEEKLETVASRAPFTHFAEDDRGQRGLPSRRHFKFYYQPVFANNPAPFVILDVVEEAETPHEIIHKPILPSLLEIDREITVAVPSIESLLADKLTAFAPKTIGVPFEPAHGHGPDTMQIMKQLFDVGELFDIADDISTIRTVYEKVYVQESHYRGGSFTSKQTLDDSLEAALHLSMHGLRGAGIKHEAELLMDGTRKLTSHLINHRFGLREAKVAAAKAALSSRIIRTEENGESLGLYRALPDINEIREMEIKGDWGRLNLLKNTSPEAFYYWYQAAKLQSTIT